MSTSSENITGPRENPTGELPYRLYASTDALGAAVGYLSREWGDYGYTIENVTGGPRFGGCVLHVAHFDGSRFFVGADRWGNCRHADTLAGIHAALLELDQ